MNRLRLSTPGILLLGLAALLVFGSCGGGVRWMLYTMPLKQKRQLRRVRQLEERAHRAARQQRGPARQQALLQARAARQRQLDSLKLDAGEQWRMRHRWRKVTRQLPAAIRADSLWQLRDSLRRYGPRLSDQ